MRHCSSPRGTWIVWRGERKEGLGRVGDLVVVLILTTKAGLEQRVRVSIARY